MTRLVLAALLGLIALDVSAQTRTVASTLRLVVSSQSIADNGGGTAAAGGVTPSASYVSLTCLDADGCTVTLSETGARDGFVLTVVNVGSNTATFSDSSGVQEIGGSVALGQHESLSLVYNGDRWVEVSRSGGAMSAVVLTTDVTGTLPIANGGTNVTSATDDNVLVGNGTTFQLKAIGDCDTGATSKLLYDVSTNAFSCGTDQTSGNSTRTLGLTIDGGGSVITTGVKGFVVSPATCTITSATLLSTDASATSGSIVIDVWKDTYANYPPANADSITASAPPTLSSANKSQDSTLTGWTTSVTAGDVLGFTVDSATTVTRVSLFLGCQ
jgi:hypothetical protein